MGRHRAFTISAEYTIGHLECNKLAQDRSDSHERDEIS